MPLLARKVDPTEVPTEARIVLHDGVAAGVARLGL